MKAERNIRLLKNKVEQSIVYSFDIEEFLEKIRQKSI